MTADCGEQPSFYSYSITESAKSHLPFVQKIRLNARPTAIFAAKRKMK
jgi:hypothetical protein